MAPPLASDVDGVSAGAGDGASGVVDDEVVAVELVRSELGVAAQRYRLDRRGVFSCGQRCTNVARPIRRIGEHLQAGFLAGE